VLVDISLSLTRHCERYLLQHEAEDASRYHVEISCGDILWRYLHSSIHHVEISTLFYISCGDILWRYLHSSIYHVEISCGDIYILLFIMWRYLVEISTFFYISCGDIYIISCGDIYIAVGMSLSLTRQRYLLQHVEISTLLWVCLFLSHAIEKTHSSTCV